MRDGTQIFMIVMIEMIFYGTQMTQIGRIFTDVFNLKVPKGCAKKTKVFN
jgi:hypothetical protein